MTQISKEEELVTLIAVTSAYLRTAELFGWKDNYSIDMISRLLGALSREKAKVEELNNELMVLKGK